MSDGIAKTKLWAFPVLYTAALLQGLVQVSFVALSGHFTGQLGVTEAQYGSIFVPQLVGAIIGGLLAALFAGRLGLVKTLFASAFCNTLSQVLLVLAVLIPQFTYPLLLAATLSVGTGFGVSSAPLNLIPGILFPNKRSFALLSLHTLIGIGLALGPFVSGYLVQSQNGLILPIALLCFGVLILLVGVQLLIKDSQAPLVYEAESLTFKEIAGLSVSPPFWRFWLVVILYAFMESTLSNWAVIYLNQYKLFTPEIAAWGLTAFWSGLAIGRLIVAGLSLWISSRVLWQLMPILPALSLFFMPYIRGEEMGIALFGIAGLGCSAIFPLCISLAAERYPRQATQIAPLYISSLMVGIGVCSYGVGWLREFFTFEAIYQFSIIYPLLMFGLMLLEQKFALGKKVTATSAD